MTTSHLALIVEDDRATADDLADILKSMGCDSITIDNKDEALSAFRTKKFCFVLLDLQIKADSGSIRGHVANGSSLLQEIRKIDNKHADNYYRLPILIISGFARERDAAVDAMKDGASDIVDKPLKSRDVCEAIRRALVRSGRSDHANCTEPPLLQPAESNSVVTIAIPGDLVRRRARVLVDSRPIDIIPSSLKLLLRLMVAHENKETVHMSDLGAKNDKGFKGPSVLRDALKPALGDEVNIILNHYHGYYSLANCVTIVGCNADKLAEMNDHEITDLARKVQRSLGSRGKSDGNS